MKKHIIFSIIFLVVLVVVGLWIAYYHTNVNVNKKTLVLFPLTGDFAEYGQDELRAILLFLEDNGYNLDDEIIVKDNETDPKVAVNILQFYSSEDIDSIFVIGSSISLSIQQIVNEKKIPTISVGYNPNIAKGYMYQNMITSEDVINILKEKLPAKTVVIYRLDDFGKSIIESLSDLNVISLGVLPNEKDYKSVVTKALRYNPEGIFLVDGSDALGAMIREIRLRDKEVPIYGLLEMGYPEVKKIAGDSYKNIKYVSFNINTEDAINFKKRYVSKYGSEPTLDSLLGYIEAQIIFSCKKDQTRTIKDCLDVSTFETLVGPVKIENNRINYISALTIIEE